MVTRCHGRGVIIPLFVLAAIMPVPMAWSSPASPRPIGLIQPDGTSIILRPRGGPGLNWFEDLQGYAVVRVGKEYQYAQPGEGGRLAPSGLLVGKANPQSSGLEPGLRPQPAQGDDRETLSTSCSLPVPADRVPLDLWPRQATPATGTVKNLVVLCKFSDHVLGVHTRDAADYDTLYNSAVADAMLCPTGSVKMCFTENSYGALTLESTVVAWVTLPQTQAYYANGQNGTAMTYPQNAQGMVRDALDLVDPLIDFGEFDANNDGYIDAITIIHSGYGAETGGGGGGWIWSHKWSLWALPGGFWTSGDASGGGGNVKVYDYHTEPALWGTSGNAISRIGVAVHETGHFFGLPDLYDTDGTSEGIGSWCMMANSWGFDFTQLRPPHFSAWCKIGLNWVTPTVISTADTYTAPRVEDHATIFKISTGYPANEYLLIENRQPFGFESAMPQGGLAIWHIDDNKANNRSEGYPGQAGWPTNNNHYMVALLQADGTYDMEKNLDRGDATDLFRAGGVSTINANTTPSTNGYQGGVVTVTNHAITNISASGASMTFDFVPGGEGGGEGVKAEMTSPANGATFDSATVTFEWDAGTNVTEYWLSIGTSVGGNTLLNQSQGTNLSKQMTNLPTDGSTIHVRLWSEINGDWEYNDYSYTAATVAPAKATMTSPADEATFNSATVTFEWDAGTGVTQYWLSIGTTAGGNNLLNQSQGTSLSKQVTNMPTNGSTVYVRLFSKIGSAWEYNDYTYTAATVASGKATMTSPADEATFDSATVTFEWDAGTNVTEYWLYIGTSAGGSNLLNQTQGTNLSKQVTNMPTNGSTVYVRLFSKIGSVWEYNDYTYTAATVASGKATMTSPADEATFDSATVTFEWDAGTNVTEYWLYIGTSAGGSNLLNQTQGTNLSKQVTNMPTNGSTVYVRLFSKIGSAWEYNDYTYTAATVASGKATMTSPANGATFDSATVTFEWDAGTNVTEYWLYIGTSAGGSNLLNQTQGTNLSKQVTNMPTNGSTVYVRLFSKIGSAWEYNDSTYTAATVASGKATMTSPANGATLAGAAVTFEWDAGTGVSQYWLYVGRSLGSTSLFNQSQGVSLSKEVTGLPTDGGAVHVRLWSKIGASWEYNDYAYTAATIASDKAEMTSPVNGSTLEATSVTFEWDAGTGVTEYWLAIGTTVGGTGFLNQSQGTNLSKQVNNMPANASTVYVRLWSKMAGAWQYNDYSYTALNGAAAMTSPANGATLPGAEVTFQWNAGTSVAQYWLSIGTSQGDDSLYSASAGTSLSAAVTGLPTDGGTIHVRLWSRVGSTWVYRDYSYTASS